MLEEYLTNIGLEWKHPKKPNQTLDEFVQQQLAEDPLMKKALAKRESERLLNLLKASLRTSGVMKIKDNRLLMENLGLLPEANRLPIEVIEMIVVRFTSGLETFEFHTNMEALEGWIQLENQREKEKKVDRKNLLKKLIGRYVPQEKHVEEISGQINDYTNLLKNRMMALDIQLGNEVEKYAKQKIKETEPKDALKKGQFLLK